VISEPVIRQVDWDHPHAAALRAAQRAEIDERYGTPDSEPGIAPSASDITAFFVAYVGDEPAGCGGLRRLDDDHAEIKRMFVARAHRGSGISTAIVRELERYGREAGWSRLALETGDRQPDAVRFYEREGFTRIPNFGHYVDSESSLCFGKAL
jgi:GNAT superfamily N-acetyltransferase